MANKIVSISKKQRPMAYSIAKTLRRHADALEAGKCRSLVVGFMHDTPEDTDVYYSYHGDLADAHVMCSILKDMIVTDILDV